MLELSENTISVLKQIDPDLPQYLDFVKLRKEGLEHIGNLSGKIWTDHNVHDPGITILEALIYALIDLGYKTNLPFQDLIAKADNQHKDDNFLTPLEILTINPVTITDYRKLLLELPDVRNAWLEPVDQEVELYIDQNSNSLRCSKPFNSSNTDCRVGDHYEQLHLNGLYKVYIEKENGVTDEEQLKTAVKELLAQHRNLCEDFTTIKILEPIEFGVCMDVEITLGYDPKIVYAKIIKAIKNFIQPEINYYTLSELLNKGKAIETIFAGRPYSEKSFGFVDTEELEKLERRSEIHLSDLYNVILSIEGVRKIKKLHISKGKNVSQALEWIQNIGPCQVPVFSMEHTCVDLYSAQGLLQIDKFKIQQSFSFSKKFELPLTSLDTEIPFGVYHEDLDDYYSIQNDFPVVYGIGEDGLPESATLLRKTQALQLKGYLLFYDQLLANYTSQLAHIRNLFSLKPETERNFEDKKTYFTQIPESVTGIEELLRFYDQNETQYQNSVLAFPVLDDDQWKKALADLYKNPRTEFSIKNTCDGKSQGIDLFTFSSVNIRSIYINQLIASFFTQNYTIEILEDRFGCFFVIHPNAPADILMVGTKRYESISKATSEAKNVAFIAATLVSYNLVTHTSESLEPDQHYFGIIYHPISYINLIQELTENKEEYHRRRKQFLDHLLARFGEEFTEYTLLQYKGKKSEAELNQELVNDQSSYLNEFAELSRNRGKAFNYSEPSWNTNNVSGFEKRVSLLSGINNYQRRNLCNFEVTECYRLLLNGPDGMPLFRSNRSYETKEELHHAAKKVLLQLRDSKSYQVLEKNLNGFNGRSVSRIFSEKPNEEHIIITKYRFNQQLINSKNEEVGLGKPLSSEAIALQKKDEFIKGEIKHALPNFQDASAPKKYHLLPVAKENYYVDASFLDESLKIKAIETWKWHAYETASKEKSSSEHAFHTSDEAWEDLVEKKILEPYLTTYKIAYKWTLNLPNEKIIFQGVECYPDKNTAIAAWRKAKVFGGAKANYALEKEKNTARLVLKNEKKKIIAVAVAGKKDKATQIADFVSVFNDRKTKPTYITEANKVGFKIAMNDTITPIVSYCVYDSKKEALQEMGKAFTLGSNKKNYLPSGDEGNPEYNFLLRDENNSFLALPSEHFEIASNRDAALHSVMQFFKKNESPVFVKKQPNKYTWTLFDTQKVVLKSTSEFTSQTKAKADFDTTIAREALKSCYTLCKEHIYQFAIKSTPSEYNFIYGNSNSDNELNPIFISKEVFKSSEEAKSAYANFVKKLPQLALKISEENNKVYNYGLYDKKVPIAIQYKGKLGNGSLTEAKLITKYISEIYINDETPNEEFVANEMAENQRKSYEWRFYKKNAPLARNPYLCVSKEQSDAIKRSICDVIPPINLKKCPVKEIVVCPDKDKKMYHYQVCFTDNEDNEFILISYVGYTTYEEAKEAWEKEWLMVINLARDPEQYRASGKISLTEEYKSPESKECNEASFIAVVPAKKKTTKQSQELIDYYTQQAELFPIYKVEANENNTKNSKAIEECIGAYKYRVVVKNQELITSDCELAKDTIYQGTLLWDSVDCYYSIEETIAAYQHFYTLAGTPNNCRILCEKGKFYVGLIEVLAESFCDFKTEAEAWDDAFPDSIDSCGNCIPRGVRAFIYAAEDDKNYIPICDQDYWKFKVVAPSYYVADHNCWYNSTAERDKQKNRWRTILETLDWSTYVSGIFFESNPIISVETSLTHFTAPSTANLQSHKAYCDLVHDIRDCLKMCTKGVEKAKQNEENKRCLIEKLKGYLCPNEELKNGTCIGEKLAKHHKALELLELVKLEGSIAILQSAVKQFPIYKTDERYCFRLYWGENDKVVSEGGLTPCGCEEESFDDKPCEETYPFISSNCYSCCSEAFVAFYLFCELFQNKKTYELAPVSKTKNGPYSFQIIDTSQELAYHPQQYNCLQEVEDAIQLTKACVDNTGMHLLEHILLRPTTLAECGSAILTNDNAIAQQFKNCLLPICPDYCCDIAWQPDMDQDDPCAEDPDANKIYYLPGTDPYSFWATIALPAWVKRFRTEESREIFEKLLYKEAPALVGLHILWLSPRDMCKFEDEYRRWLEWIASSKEFFCNPEKGSPLCGLSEGIKVLKSEPACTSTPDKQGDCNCQSKEEDTNDACCLPLETFGTIFWSCCEEEENTPMLGTTANLASSAIEKPKVTKKASLKEVIKETTPNLLALVRQRKPKYLSNSKALADEDILKTKSYERTVFFLQNTPTIAGYVALVNFFKKYSLQKDNHTAAFVGLLKNATWHLLDTLVLHQKGAVPKKELNTLASSFESIKKKGLSLQTLGEEWKIEEVQSLANAKALKQLTALLK